MSIKFDKNSLYEELSNAAKNISGKNNVPIDELFTEDFMSEYTPLKSFSDFLEIGGWDLFEENALDNIPIDEINDVVRNHTSFNSWHDMQETAVGQYFAKKLGF